MVNAKIKLVTEFYGTFGTKYFIEIITAASTSIVEISETKFQALLREQVFTNMPVKRDEPLPNNVHICNERKEWE